MTMYQPTIPTGNTNLNIDYQNIQNNFRQLDTTYGVDHVAYSLLQNNGYHRTVHLVPVSTASPPFNNNGPTNNPPNVPAPTPGFGQVLSAQINDGYGTPDEALYFLTGGNKLLQLTSNLVPSLGISGYTFLPGGVIIQWGSNNVTGPGDSGTVTFSPSFQSAAYIVVLGLQHITAPNSASSVSYKGLTKLKFDWVYQGSTNISSFTWLCIGK